MPSSSMVGAITSIPSLLGVVSEIPNIYGKMSIPDRYFPNEYTGEYEIVPNAYKEVTLKTSGLLMEKDVTCLKIPKFSTSNLAGGHTITIAKEV